MEPVVCCKDIKACPHVYSVQCRPHCITTDAGKDSLTSGVPSAINSHFARYIRRLVRDRGKCAVRDNKYVCLDRMIAIWWDKIELLASPGNTDHMLGTMVFPATPANTAQRTLTTRRQRLKVARKHKIFSLGSPNAYSIHWVFCYGRRYPPQHP